jgi:hypothetical protein
MVDLIDPAPGDTPADAGVVTIPSSAADRRRPGRLERVSPTLLPLLRKPARSSEEVPADAEPNRFVRGMVFALLLSAVLWALIGLGVWLIIF